jgi:hypothetical protein
LIENKEIVMTNEKKHVDDSRPVYEAPKAMKLNGTGSSLGDCLSSGSGDTQDCQTNGNTAGDGCYDGPAAVVNCETGNLH